MLNEANREQLIFEVDTKLGVYQVIDRIYSGRPARLLYSSRHKTAQSGIALDGNSLMLFGYNQRFVELVEILKPAKVLIIGGGVYTLATYLVNNFMNIVQLDVVEPNDQFDQLASRFFGLKPNDRLAIHHDFGLNYLTSSNQQYDLIIVDAYSDDRIPDEIMSSQFADLLSKSLVSGGSIAINIISSLSPDGPLNVIQQKLHKLFQQITIYPADADQSQYYLTHNYVLVASNVHTNIQLKYPPLSRGIDI